MRSTSYTATSITEVPAFMYHPDCNSEHLNGRHAEDSELAALKSGETYAWVTSRIKSVAVGTARSRAAEMYSTVRKENPVCPPHLSGEISDAGLFSPGRWWRWYGYGNKQLVGTAVDELQGWHFILLYIAVAAAFWELVMSRTRAASDVCHFLKLLKLCERAHSDRGLCWCGDRNNCECDDSKAGGVSSMRRWCQMWWW